jgi:hypothetical protein
LAQVLGAQPWDAPGSSRRSARHFGGKAMSASTKLGVLLLAGLVGWGVSEFDLVSRSPPELTAAAVKQLESSEGAAVYLRESDAAKNAWLALWPLAVVVLAGLLFWDDVVAWCTKPYGESAPLTPGPSPRKGERGDGRAED